MKTSDLPANEWVQVLDMFDELVAVSQSEQQAKLATIDLSSQARDILIKMLDSHKQPNILDQTIDPLIEHLLGHESVQVHINPSDIIGRIFGTWQATEKLASGGMGQVFVAQRSDGQFEKKVALKIIKSGGFSELSRQRFFDEMRTLAQFEHPHIARLIDGGTSDDGIAYFVMELVHGLPITEYANQQFLSLQERLGLFQQAIEAVEYAHQNLVVHGDIKPANLLVNESGQVKLVDFGIARPLQNQQPATYLPQFTPSYSAPEQAQGKPLSTASDVFGLCAVMYEVCTGSPPRDRAAVTTQVDLNTQVETTVLGVYQRLESNLQHHPDKVVKGVVVSQLKRALSRELGTIIDKGLSTDISKRYKNTSALNRDLQLFLQGDVVPTYGQGMVYKWFKFWQKFRLPVLLSGVALLGIIGFVLVAINQAKVARDESAKAQWANQFLLGIFTAADPVKNQQNPITVNELTGLAADKLLADDHNVLLKAESLGMLSQIQYRLGEVQSATLLNSELIKLLQHHPDKQAQLALAHISAGTTMEAQDNLDDAVNHFRQAMSLMPISNNVNETSVRAALSLVNTLIRLNQNEEAGEISRSVAVHEPAITRLPVADSLMATNYALKAKLLLTVPEFEQGIEALKKAKQHALKVSDEPMLYPHILGIESDAYFAHGDGISSAGIDRELVTYFSKNFGPDHPETIDNLGRLAVSLSSLGEMESAIEINQRIISNLLGTEIKNHQLPAAYLNVGTAYQVLGQHQLALDNYRHAQSLWPNLEPRIPLYEASTEVRMAASLMAQQQWDLSHQYFTSALKTIGSEVGNEHPLYARFQLMYAPWLLAQGRLEAAQSVIPAARNKMIDAYGENSKRTAVANIRLAQLRAAQGDAEGAAALSAAALKVLDVETLRKRYKNEIQLAQQMVSQLQSTR